jgi:hypothetical protein
MEYQVRQGKRKMYIIGAGFTDKQSAIDFLIKQQRDYSKRGMYIVKIVPYGASRNIKQVVPV